MMIRPNNHLCRLVVVFSATLCCALQLTAAAPDAADVTTPLSDLAPLSASQGWGQLATNRSVWGKPLQIGERRFAHGLGTHAASELVYELAPGAERFEAWVGVDAAVRQYEGASVVFKVMADGRELFDSGVMKADTPAKRVSVAVAGADELTLVVTDAGDGGKCDHADWAEAVLIGKPKPAAAIPAPRPVKFRVQSADLTLELSDQGELVGAAIGPRRFHRALSGCTALARCTNHGTVASRELDGGGIEFKRAVVHTQSNQRATVTERFLPAKESVRWEIEITGEDAPWTTGIETQLKWPNDTTRFWTAWNDPQQQVAGMFLAPTEQDDERYPRFLKGGQTSVTQMRDYSRRMRAQGFRVLNYFNVTEFGGLTGNPPAADPALAPKDRWKNLHNLQRVWPCCGLPEKLVCDRGPDLTSKDLEDAAFQLGIELDFNPPRTPHFKGTVESFFDGLNDQLSASLPGRTFRNWADRADYKPDDGPLLSYKALLEVIHIYLVDVYSIAKHPTAEITRLEMWQESASVHSPMLPAAADDLLVLLAKHADRTLSARGIELGGMFYTSDDLMALRAEMAAHNVHVDRLSIRYNPWDLGEVWVLNPVDNRYLKATAVDPAMKGITAYQWRVLKRAVRQRFDGPEHLQNLSQGRNAIRDVVEQAMHKPSGKRRVRAARYLQAPPATLSTDVEESHPASVASPSTTAHSSPDEPASGSDQAGDRPPANPLPAVDPADLDVSDWEVASPDL